MFSKYVILCSKDGNSELYSLSDFKGLNKIRSFQKSYRNERFGALPNIQDDKEKFIGFTVVELTERFA